jgi:hypothetical protein
VTPAQIQPWTRIFNIEAGHFDTRTAYAAANTLRIDDARPHFWRTHDGGKTWTEIDNGIAPNAVANSIREDPRVPGLLYASTDVQVWVSFDDGANWQSLRLNMPAISVRDIQVKDSDLVAGTHGRGFWILDDLSPLRQEAALRRAAGASRPYLVKPATAVRVRFGNNEPTPWPPELPAGENPPDGAVIDYFLPTDASTVTLEIVDSRGKVVRTYMSTDSASGPDPAIDPAGYDVVCRANPGAPDCTLPLYWPAPRPRLWASAGVHRFTWDMRYQPIAPDSVQRAGEVNATGAVPHRSVHGPFAPWAAPGRYTVRLTVNGAALTQPLIVRLAPRVKASVAGLQQLATLTREMYDAAVATHGAYVQARARLDAFSGAARAQVESLAPAPGAPPRRRGPPRAAQAASPTLESASNAAMDAALAMDGADVTPTAAQVAACARARTQVAQVLARWNRLNGTTPRRGGTGRRRP